MAITIGGILAPSLVRLLEETDTRDTSDKRFCRQAPVGGQGGGIACGCRARFGCHALGCCGDCQGCVLCVGGIRGSIRYLLHYGGAQPGRLLGQFVYWLWRKALLATRASVIPPQRTDRRLTCPPVRRRGGYGRYNGGTVGMERGNGANPIGHPSL